jgi:hypothetical protein
VGHLTVLWPTFLLPIELADPHFLRVPEVNQGSISHCLASVHGRFTAGARCEPLLLHRPSPSDFGFVYIVCSCAGHIDCHSPVNSGSSVGSVEV